jgi:predicted  nucleic acid-binding Zn-ribbon protein
MVQSSSVPAATGEWECVECGYVEEGVQSRRPKECPECGAASAAFEFFADDDSDEEEWDSDEDDELAEEDEDEDDELDDEDDDY